MFGMEGKCDGFGCVFMEWDRRNREEEVLRTWLWRLQKRDRYVRMKLANYRWYSGFFHGIKWLLYLSLGAVANER